MKYYVSFFGKKKSIKQIFLSKSMPNFNFPEIMFYERKEKSDETFSFYCSDYLYCGAEFLQLGKCR